MATEDTVRLNRIVDAIADGAPVDWSALPEVPGHPAGETRDALQAIDRISKFFRERNVGDTDTSLGEVLVAASTASRTEPSTGPDLSHGEPWDRLIKLEWIGGGTYGDVHRAWDPVLEKVVALKLTRYASGPDATRALNEAQRVARIPPHPNVITVHGAHRIGNEVGIWMEFLRGRTLQSVVQDQGELGWEEATNYGISLCRALVHVHGHHVLHRDLKAANIVKAAGGRVVLIDFGSSVEILPAGAPDSTRLVGTLPYTAPELFRGEPATPQSDIYSLGVLLFNLVTDTYPVTGTSLEHFKSAHRLGRRSRLHDLRSDLPMPFVQVVERAIEPDLERRYKTAGELLRALDQSVRPVPAPAPVDTWATRVLWALLILSGAFTAIGVVTKRVSNVALERSEFAADTVTDWLAAGFKASVEPGFWAIVAFVALQLLAIGARHACATSSRLGGFEARCRKQLGDAARRARLDDTSVCAACLLLLSIAAIGSGWWYFSDFLRAVVMTRVSNATIHDLKLLSRDGSYGRYREVFTSITIGLVAAWYYMAKQILRTLGTLKNPVLLSGLFVICLSIVSLNVPYDLIMHPKGEKTRWNNSDCYVIGDRSNDLLLFCPTLTPRNRVISKSEKIDRLGEHNIFETFGQGSEK